MDPLSSITTRATPQTEQADAAQVRNSAGGFSFQVTDEDRALRFLILGTSGGSYYASEPQLTKENAAVIIKLAAGPVTGLDLVSLIVRVSTEGRAARQNPAIFALAVCAGSPVVQVRQAALAALRDVCRTGTHLFLFVGYVKQFRGMGRTVQRAIQDWYLAPEVDKVAYQTVKYRQREGWSHKDLLRMAKPTPNSPERDALFSWIAGKPQKGFNYPAIVGAYEAAQSATQPHQWVQYVRDYNLPWEALPDAALGHREVWEALLPTMGLTALMRNLGRMSKLGLFDMGSVATKVAVDRLTDAEGVTRARLHPLNILTALCTYKSGHGLRGSMTWNASPKIIDALDEAFYLGFNGLRPAGKRTLVGLDVSGSMAGGSVAGSPMTPREAGAAMSMTIARTEPEYQVMGFSHEFVHLDITGRQRLDDVIRTTSRLPFGMTDCALPMQWAAQNKVPVDTFIVITDSETYHGSAHPHQALKRYRDIMGIDARLIVEAMVANPFTVADPSDGGMLDVVGMDASTPDVIRGFSAREF